MFDDDRAGVAIGEGRFGLRLSRAGEAEELGVPTLIELRAGPFGGAVVNTVADYGCFADQLSALHASLKGEASLSSYDGFKLRLVGNGVGGVEAAVEVVGEYVPPATLKFEFWFDQSYLPRILLALAEEFPPPARKL